MLHLPDTQFAASSFEESAQAVMDELREALGAMIGAIPEPMRRAIDVERALDIDKKLAWQVFRLVHSTGLSQVANVPARGSKKRLLEAAKRRRVPKPVIERVSSAFDCFDDFALVHSGDRDGFVSMVRGISDEEGADYDLKVRKSMFRGSAHVWGVQAEMAVRTAIFVPQPGTNRVDDLAVVVGDIGLQRRRVTEPLVNLWWLNTGVSERAKGTEEDAAQIDRGLEMMPEFCSQPLPQMREVKPETELIFPPGRTGAVTLYFSHARRNVVNLPNDSFFGRTLFTMPLETMVWELMIPVGRSMPASARAAIYGRRQHPEQVFEERTADLLPQRATLQYLGVHEGMPPLTGSPNHSDAIRHVLQKEGWLGTRFDVYRCRVRYPVMHTLLVARVEMNTLGIDNRK